MEKSEEFMRSFNALCKRYGVEIFFDDVHGELQIEMESFSGSFEELYATILYKDIKAKSNAKN